MKNLIFKELLATGISATLVMLSCTVALADETDETDAVAEVTEQSDETDETDAIAEVIEQTEGTDLAEDSEVLEEIVMEEELVDEASYTGIVEINSTSFPDEIFRNYVSENFDTNYDNELNVDEISLVTNINVSHKNISDLKGIEYFTALTSLNCEYNQLSNLDVRFNTNLTELYCGNNQLACLDLSNNTELLILDCDNNQLENINLSYNTALESLSCKSNQLVSLDVLNCNQLREVFCEYNMLTSIHFYANSPIAGKYRLIGAPYDASEMEDGVLYEVDNYYINDNDGVTYCMQLHTYFCTDPARLHGKFPSYWCFLSFDTGTSIELDYMPAPEGCIYMHRLYNPNSGEHFYTSNSGERDVLVSVGWTYDWLDCTFYVRYSSLQTLQ